MKIEKLSEQEIKTLFYVALGIIVLVFLVKAGKGLLQKVGLTQSEQEKQIAAQKTKDTTQLSKDLSKTSKPTRTAAQWASVANVLDNSLNSFISDESTAYEQLSRVLTDADMGLLIQAYGIRDKQMTLPERVRDEMNEGYIDDLNRLYAKSKMRFKF